MQDERQTRRQRWKASGQLLLVLLAAMFLLELIDWATAARLDEYGIRPRHVRSLPAIVFAPLLHGGFAHLLTNALPFFVLGWLILLRGWRDFAWVSAVSAVVSGGAIWLLGKSGSVHIGVSGVVFGYYGFLVARGLFERTVAAVLTAIVAGVLYGGIIWGLLPVRADVSWEGHLGGFIGGVVCGYGLARPRRTDRRNDRQRDRRSRTERLGRLPHR